MEPFTPLPAPHPGDQPDDAPYAASPWVRQDALAHAEYGPLAAGQDHTSRSGEPEPDRPQSWFKRRVVPIGAAIIALLSKLKALLLLLPKIKLLASAGSMLVSIAAYTTIWGVWFAVGFVVLLLVHEMGHVIALRREGIRASLPMFIPFLGAVISARSLGENATAEARVGLAGPILGSAGAGLCLIISQITGDDYWRALAFTGLFLNLFNLLPVLPLDGGRAMAAMAPWMWGVGFAAMVVLALVFPNPVIFIIVLFAGFETYRRWKLRRTRSLEQAAYYRVRPRDRWLIAAVYLGLIALLVVGMDATHLQRTLG
ncbi:MAG: site-2 protease family protein [Actinomycetota bacterium]|nr:site-2 protease family protein [Actinomycetota bacterium]